MNGGLNRKITPFSVAMFDYRRVIPPLFEPYEGYLDVAVAKRLKLLADTPRSEIATPTGVLLKGGGHPALINRSTKDSGSPEIMKSS